MSRLKGVPGDDTARIAGLFSARISAARQALANRMEARGLHAKDGWRIHEEIISDSGTSAMRLRALHRTETTPVDLEIVVSLE